MWVNIPLMLGNTALMWVNIPLKLDNKPPMPARCSIRRRRS